MAPYYIEAGAPGWRLCSQRDDDGTGQVGIRASECLRGHAEGACFTVGSVAREKFFRGGKGS